MNKQTDKYMYYFTCFYTVCAIKIKATDNNKKL